MQVLSVEFLSGTQSDLQAISRLLTNNGASDRVVRDYIDRIIRRALKIGNAPRGYPLREELGPGMRVVPFEHSALIAYRVEEETVKIANVFYHGRDY